MANETYKQEKLFIGGEWVAPRDGDIRESIDPATGKPWASVAFAGAADIDAAVAAAKAALKGPWKKFSPAQRAGLMRRIAAVVEQHADHLAQLESRDNGMLLHEARANVRGLAQYWLYYSGLAEKLEGRTIPIEDGMLAYTTRVPVGVVGAIVPWNGPLQMLTWKLAPALAAGCTVVLKSAEQTPVSAYEFARLIADVGIPPGVVNIVCGDGSTAGRALVEHPDVNKISFTGEHRTAQTIMRGAAGTLKRLSFECGGKAPHIIFADANLPSAINAATGSAFAMTGQSCALGSRLLVQRPVYQQVVEELSARAARIRVGLPANPNSQMGPQTSAEQLTKTLTYFDIGKADGARLVVGGTRPQSPELADGYFVAPTVFADVTPRMRLAQEEIFGPVVSVMPFDTEEEAIAIGNDVQYGLTAGLWTQDVGRAHRVAASIEAGTVWINTYRYIRWAIPYGGFKLSGLGRENGIEGLDAYLETRSTVLNLSGQFPNTYAN